ncbi:hemagglutinin repeat-containing protein [Xanthomonas hydrangeae]|uniref:Hemagglutinin repeat-containing protein n=1 Tax=Xanthomonas hydrangeae TaxID=2775159 RepID=A0AAU0B8X4_9XANT|nr:hemagglutinin repeat-containing protein [Xanthomonas hydrangeae]WOB49165.1 hemagglutinin repeat-containing protein [Xanthomonas hydrangeae]
MGRAATGLGGINAWRSNGPGRRYLIETDPRFVNYDNFISSDFLLDKLGVDPEWTQTRLGDGFYEQRLVLDQITQLTGRRYLGNYADGVAQYRALLESGVAAAGQLQLSMGVGLTAAQAAALTQDIVWMVEQDYQGQKVLVPVVYLASNSLQLRGNGALIAGGSVELNATNAMSNQGVIAGADVSITAGNLLNQGRISGTGSVALEARNDLLNQGQIQGRDVALVAGNNLVSEATKAINGVGVLSGISASNTLQLFAGNDMTLTGTRVQADGSAALIAGNNLSLTPSALRNDNGLLRGGDAVSVTTGKDLVVSAGNDLQLHGVTIKAGGSAALQAGNNLSLTPTTGLDGKVGTRTNISTGDSLQLTAGNDLTIRQADVKAGGDLIAAAGNNLNVESVLNETETNSYNSRNGKTRVTTTTTTQSIDQQALTAGGNLILSAGNDVNLVAAKLDAGKGLGISAGNDINASTLTTVDTSNTLETRKRFKQTTSTSDETVHGTEFSAGGNLAMQAGNDITLTAASAATKDGGITLAAGNDVNLLAASEQHDAVQDMTKKKKGTFSSKTTTTHDEWQDTLAVGTSLSGDSVQIVAGNDLLSKGTQIVGTGDVTLAAGNNLTLETAQNTHSEEHDKVTTKSGLFGSGGIGVTLGKQKVTTGADIDQITHTGTTVGSLEGDVTLVAGNKLAITGSDVMALQGDLTATGKDIAITEVYNDTDTEQRSKFSQGGLSLTLSSAAISLAQAANDSYKASKEVKGDSRMEALALGSAAYSAYGAGQALAQAGGSLGGSAKDAAQGANLSIAISIGGSKSESKSTQTASVAQGSKLQAGGDVNLIATGGGDQSNLLIRGSDIKAGNDLLLAADHDVLIEAAKNTAEQKSTSKSSSASLGVGITYGPDGAAFGVMISAAGSRGKANGEDVTYSNSHLAAGNTATVISGNDTTLKGAQLSADKVIADVGGNLSIESLQDTSTYDSKDKSVGASVTFGAGFSASASYSSNKVSGDFASVTEQSGIQAGDGGFNIRVGGNTDLKGAVIASTQAAVDAGVNRLQTGTLTYSDIENTSSYDAKGFSLSGGYSKGTGDKKQQGETGQVQPTVNNGANWSWQNFQTGSTGTAAGIGSKSGDATSTTTSGISGGSLLITDEAGQLAKSGKTAADALAGLKRDVISGDDAGGLTKQWDGQALRDQVAAQAQITATAGQQATKFVGDYAQGKVDKAAELYAEAEATGDDSKRVEADQLMKDWGNGGTLRVLSHAVVGGLTGGTEGALGAAAGTVAAPYLAEALGKAGINKAVAATLTGLSASALGAAAGGAAGGAAALNEVSNNYLGHQERMEYATALIACSKSGTQCERAEQLKALSEERNLALRGACSDPASGGCAEQKQLAAAAMQDQLDHAGEYTAWLAGHVPELAGLFNSDKDGTLTKDFVTHVTTADLGHKLACAMAGDCSNQALVSATWNGSIPLSVATADSALRAALGMGAGTVGANGRVWEMVAGVVELAKGMSPAGQVGKTVDQLAYLWGNGYAATAEKNFDDAKGALNAIKTGISGYAEDLAFAAYTNTHGSWDIYDIAKAGAIGGKVSVDVFSLVAPELYAGKGGIAAKAATSVGDAFKADDVIEYINGLRPNQGVKGPDLVEGAQSLVGANRAVIDPRKLTEYALDPSHPVGGNKARVFESVLGFTKNNSDMLMSQIKGGIMNNTPVPGKVDQYGVRFTVDIPVVGPKGSGIVRSGWIYRPGSDTPELTTIFVK